MHASGFTSDPIQIEGLKTPPMRISRIIDAILTDQKATNYIAIIHEICQIIKEQTSFENVYHINLLCHEVLLYIPEYDFLREIHEATIWHLSDIAAKKNNCGHNSYVID